MSASIMAQDTARAVKHTHTMFPKRLCGAASPGRDKTTGHCSVAATAAEKVTWNDMENPASFYNELEVEPEEHPVLPTEPRLSHSLRDTTDIVIDSGDGVPIYEGDTLTSFVWLAVVRQSIFSCTDTAERVRLSVLSWVFVLHAFRLQHKAETDRGF